MRQLKEKKRFGKNIRNIKIKRVFNSLLFFGGKIMNNILTEKKKQIVNFVNKILLDIENEKIDLENYEYLLSQLKSNIEFLLRYN